MSLWENVVKVHLEKMPHRTCISTVILKHIWLSLPNNLQPPPAKQALHQLISLILIIFSSVVDGVIGDCLKWKPTYSEGHKGTRLWTTTVCFVSKSALAACLLILRQKQFKLIFYFSIGQDISWQPQTIPIVLFRTIKVTSILTLLYPET